MPDVAIPASPSPAGTAASPATKPKKRIEWLDIAKGIAIVLVVLGHTLVYETPIVQAIYSFHMPLFFLAAGYTFRPKETRSVIKASAKQLLIPYCILFILTVLPAVLFEPQLDFDMLASRAAGFFFASAITVVPFGFPPVGILWFLWALFASRVILNITTGAFEKRGVSDRVQLLIYFVFSVIGGAVGKFVFLPLALDLVTSTVFLMYIGYLVKRHNLIATITRWQWIIAAFAIWALCMLAPYAPLSTRVYPSLFAALAGTLLAVKVSMLIADHTRLIKRALLYLGVNSLLVFFLHTIEGNYIAWGSFALLAGLSHSNFAIFLLRMAWICLVMALFTMHPLKRVGKQ